MNQSSYNDAICHTCCLFQEVGTRKHKIQRECAHKPVHLRFKTLDFWKEAAMFGL